MKILYIPVAKKIKENNLKNIFICFIYNIKIILKNFLLKKKITTSTQGYIESAIRMNAKIFELPFNYCIFFSKFLNLYFDGIFINWKFTNNRKDKKIYDKLIKLSKKFNIKKVIVDTTDLSYHLIRQDVLEKYDFVIKREKHKSITNEKYLTTMLPLKLIEYKVQKKNEFIEWPKIGRLKPNIHNKYDVFFSGTSNNKRRTELVNLLKNSNIKFYGGLKRIPFNDYLKTIYNSSINLAIAGVGGAEFTFRHLEILSCCSFLMCHEEINKLDLPLPLKDGVHFVSYRNNEDVLEKINFYLKNDHLRKKIAQNGRNILVEHYSPQKHGYLILKKIFY